MASTDKTKKLTGLVNQAGSIRKSVELIKEARGHSPTKSSISRAMNGSGTDYSVQCMIDDLNAILNK